MDAVLGYRMGDDGKPYIIEEEAEVVRYIFKAFAEGHSMKEIAAETLFCITKSMSVMLFCKSGTPLIV